MTVPEMEQVNSRALSGIAYDAQEKILYVEFPNGVRYAYYDVPQLLFTHLRVVESKGRFLMKLIKGKYRYKEVTNG